MKYIVEKYDWPDDGHYRLVKLGSGGRRLHVARSHGDSYGDHHDLQDICDAMNDIARLGDKAQGDVG